MSEVLTRSLITTSCTLLPVIALLAFGGATLKDFAFALLIGVASGAYSSIFIASPVLTHWKEREHAYRSRRARIIADLGHVPPYADGGDVDPTPRRVRSTATLTAPQDENVSNAEFEQMKRDLGLEEEQPQHRRSRLAERTAHTSEEDDAPAAAPRRGSGATSSTLTPPQPAESPVPGVVPPSVVSAPADDALDVTETPPAEERAVTPAPDEPENEGVVKPPPASPRRAKARNRRHGRKR
jgi:SecD/SecF fusion protein